MAVETLKAYYKNDDLKILSEGISQGGGLSLALASLHRNVCLVASDVPFLCHFRRGVEVAVGNPYAEISHFFKIQDPLHRLEPEVYKNLSYIDLMNHAPRIQVPALMSVGLEDNVCPPSTVFATYNHLAGEKSLRIYRDFAHGGFSLQEEEKLRFFEQNW